MTVVSKYELVSYIWFFFYAPTVYIQQTNHQPTPVRQERFAVQLPSSILHESHCINKTNTSRFAVRVTSAPASVCNNIILCTHRFDHSRNFNVTMSFRAMTYTGRFQTLPPKSIVWNTKYWSISLWSKNVVFSTPLTRKRIIKLSDIERITILLLCASILLCCADLSDQTCSQYSTFLTLFKLKKT